MPERRLQHRVRDGARPPGGVRQISASAAAPPPHKDPHEMTNTLLYHAEREETGEYTQALDALFRRYPEELAGLAEFWARLRSTLPAADAE